MGLEAATYISELVQTNPVGAVDDYATADDHLRLIKAVLKGQFPNFTAAAMNTSVVELNLLSGLTAAAAELNTLDGYTGNTADLNVIAGTDAAGLTAAELLFVADVTSLIQAQLDGKSASGHTHPAADIVSGTVAIAQGGTAAATAAAARISLGVDIGADVQAFFAGLDDIGPLARTDGNFIVGNGSNWIAEIPSAARASLGLGTLALLNTINNANWSGTDLTAANGGTGGSGSVTGSGNNVLSASPTLTGTAVIATAQIVTGNITTMNIGGNSDTSLTRDSAGKASIESRSIAMLDDASFASCRITESTGAPSGGTNGDIHLQRDA